MSKTLAKSLFKLYHIIVNNIMEKNSNDTKKEKNCNFRHR